LKALLATARKTARISINTVKNHIHNVCEKLGAEGRLICGLFYIKKATFFKVATIFSKRRLASLLIADAPFQNRNDSQARAEAENPHARCQSEIHWDEFCNLGGNCN